MAKESVMEIDFTEQIKARNISTKERNSISDEDFVDSKNRAFPINKAADVPAAVHSWGRYKGPMSFEAFKARLIQIAKRKGFEGSLPKEWSNPKSA